MVLNLMVVSSASRYMLKSFWSIHRILVIGDLYQAWYFNSGRYSAPPYLLAIYSTNVW